MHPNKSTEKTQKLSPSPSYKEIAPHRCCQSTNRRRRVYKRRPLPLYNIKTFITNSMHKNIYHFLVFWISSHHIIIVIKLWLFEVYKIKEKTILEPELDSSTGWAVVWSGCALRASRGACRAAWAVTKAQDYDAQRTNWSWTFGDSDITLDRKISLPPSSSWQCDNSLRKLPSDQRYADRLIHVEMALHFLPDRWSVACIFK